MTCEIDFEPVGRRVVCHEDAAIYEAARDAGVGLDSFCGGKGTCGKCKIRIVSGEVSSLTEKEKAVFTPEEIARGYRLACLTKVHRSIKVEIPLECLVVSHRLQLAGVDKEVSVDPIVEAYTLNLSAPTMHDIRSDEARLNDCLAHDYGLTDIRIDLPVQRQMPDFLRDNDWQAKAGLRDDQEITWIGSRDDRLLGAAVDLGTTKIAAYLTDLQTGKVLASLGSLNRQVSYGEDIISRINYALTVNSETLRQVVTENLKQLIHQLCTDCGFSSNNVVEVVVVGNTAMHHLFLGLPVKQLGLAPYVPAIISPVDIKARDLGLGIAPGAYVHLLPNIAGFVGADHVAMLLATDLYCTDKTVLGMDIGTNTEISLASHGGLISCSCASGPAFEGAHIRDGMRATGGAIERVQIKGSSINLQTINNEPPIGICGSGIIDAVAQLREADIIDEIGRFRLHPCVRSTDNGKEFVLVPISKSGNGKDITINQKDISEIQMAKGAIASGISILLANAKVNWKELDQIIIAGAFGSYIDVDAAITIAMLPPLPKERFLQVGNAAGVGAKLALISKEQRKLAVEIARKVKYVELMTHSGYPKLFSNALRLSPERNWPG